MNAIVIPSQLVPSVEVGLPSIWLTVTGELRVLSAREVPEISEYKVPVSGYSA
jgi:hypothetical protein